MNIEDKISKADTKEIVINEYMNLDEEDIKNKIEYKIKIRKITVKQQTDISKGIAELENKRIIPYDLIVKTLLYGVISTPFESWDEEKIKWLDETNPDILKAIFKGVLEFNLPLELKKEMNSGTLQ